jgi:hypothetical protein
MSFNTVYLDSGILGFQNFDFAVAASRTESAGESVISKEIVIKLVKTNFNRS